MNPIFQPVRILHTRFIIVAFLSYISCYFSVLNLKAFIILILSQKSMHRECEDVYGLCVCERCRRLARFSDFV